MTTSLEQTGPGLESYFQSHIDALDVELRSKIQNLRRLEAQRNELNTTGT